MTQEKRSTGRFSRLICLLAVLALMLPAMNAPASEVTAKYGYTTVANAMFRPQAGTTDYIARLPANWAADILGTTTVGGDLWYRVKTNLPTRLDREYYGYLKSTVFRPMTAAEEAAWAANPTQGSGTVVPVITATPIPGVVPTVNPNPGTLPYAGQLRIIKDNVDMVDIATGTVRLKLNTGIVLNYSGQPTFHNGISYQYAIDPTTNVNGYLPQGTFEYVGSTVPQPVVPTAVPAPGTAVATVRLITGATLYNGTSIYAGVLRNMMSGTILSALGTEQVASTGGTWLHVYEAESGFTGYINSGTYEYVVRNASGIYVPVTAPDTGLVTGTLEITKPGTAIRRTPGGEILGRLDQGRQLSFYGSPASYGGYSWLYIMDDKPTPAIAGYVRSDCYKVISSITAAPTVVPSVTPGNVLSNTAVVTVNAANLRQTPGGVTITGYLVGARLTVLETPADTVGGWYRVTGGGFTGYILGNQIRVLTVAELSVITPVPSQAPATGMLGEAKITQVRTNLRRTPGGPSLKQLDVNLVVPYFSLPIRQGGYDWLYVRDPATGVYGYVRGDCYQILSGGVTAAPTVPGVTATPAAGQVGYVKVTKHNTNLRRTPGGQSQLQMPIDLVLPLFSTTSQLGYNWAYVYHASGIYGYVRSDCFVFTDAAGNPVTTPVPTVPPIVTYPPYITPEPGGAVGGQVKLIKGYVNLRQEPGGKSFAQLAIDTVLPFYGFAQQGGYTWYYVVAPQGAGYVRGDMVIIVSGTVGPTTQPPETGSLGYLITTKDGVNLRKTPTTGGEVFLQVERGTVWPLINPIVNNMGYNWYFVRVNNRTGYLRGDCVRMLTDAEVTAYLAGVTPGITPPPGPVPPGTDVLSGHIITTMSSVNVRSAPSLDAQQLTQLVNAGAVLPFYSTVSSGGRQWYKVQYAGQVAYVLSSLARIMTAQEYQDYIHGTPGVTVAPGPIITVPPNPADLSSTAVTVMDRVLVRATAGMSGQTLTVLYQRGSVAKLRGQSLFADNYSWYPVSAGGVSGYIRGDMLRILTKQEEAAMNPGTTPGTPGTPAEATYRTLQRGSTGADVTRLQTELARLGFLAQGAVTGVYTTETVEAVRSYQLSAGLFVDGIAGPNTQHRMYGTVPAGTYTPGTGTGDTTLYPVEKVDWYTGDIQQAWPNGTTAVLTDVKTGLTYRARRWAGGYHADVEPLTAADTAVMCRFYGVNNAQEIADKNLYERRPTWVTIGGRSFAASIYGIPHNYPQGDTIKDNDFSGQFCVHFVNSKTHSTVRVDPGHMAAIDYAYNNAPSRK